MTQQKVDVAAVKRVLEIEIPHWINGGTNFTSILLYLISKSDPSNKYKLRQHWPAEVKAIELWQGRNSDYIGDLIEALSNPTEKDP